MADKSYDLDIEYQITLADMSRCCGVPAEKILLLVAEGVLTPSDRSQREWIFAGGELGRALSALRLERDLGVNPAGAALAIELLDEMQRLRERVHLLEALTFDR